MKTLYDGTQVPKDTPTKLTDKGRELLTQEEIAAREAEEAAWEEGRTEREAEQARQQRRKAYQLEADPIYFKWQRSDATVEQWTAKINEIRNRYPIPTGE
jgi:cell division protein FtsN